MSGANNDRERKLEGAAKLLGGYSAGNLTGREQQLLFEAALQDQGLFEQLMGEQALKEALEEPGAKAGLIAALEPKPSLVDRIRAWMTQPIGWGVAGLVATTAALLIMVSIRAPFEDRQTASVKTEAQAVHSTAADAELQRSQADKELKARPAALPFIPGTQAKARTQGTQGTALPAAPPLAPTPSPLAAADLDRFTRLDEPAHAPAPVVSAGAAGAVAATGAPRGAEQAAAAAAAAPPPPAALMERFEMARAAAPGAGRAPLTLDYALLRQGPSGKQVVAPGDTLRRGEPLWIRLKPNRDGFLTVYQRDSRQRIVLVAPVQVALEGRELILPAEGSLTASAESQSFVFAISEDAAQLRATTSESPLSSFRQKTTAKRAVARDELDVAPVLVSPQQQRANLPAPAGSQIAAQSAAATILTFEIIVPPATGN